MQRVPRHADTRFAATTDGIALMTNELVDRLSNLCRGGPECKCTAQNAIRELTQLRGNLSLAEERLASAAQQIIDFENSGHVMQAEITRLQNHLINVKQARLDWAMVCECQCAACETFSNFIRLIGRGAVEPTSAELAVQFPAPGEDHPALRKISESVKPLDGRLTVEPSEQRIPVHIDATGKTREPPHCPTCSCGLPLDEQSVPSAGHDSRCPAMKPVVESPGPMQIQRPMPCWCPYCGEPHSPAIRETKDAVKSGAFANAHCNSCGVDYIATQSHVCPATNWNVASNSKKNQIASDAGLIRPSSFDRDLPCWHELPQEWKDRLSVRTSDG
jgi:hypothetical protein